MTRFVVTATPPTPNGDLHVGHLSGPFLGADVFNRFQRLRGNQSTYLCSSDDHQSYVVTTARRLGLDPQDLAASCTEKIQRTLAAADIGVDFYTRALGNARHERRVKEFVRLLFEHGVIEPMRRETHWCDSCDRWLFESFLRGICPYCGEGAAGNLCEACGRAYDPIKLIDPRCTLCDSQPSVGLHDGLFVRLEKLRPELERFYATRTTWRPHLLALIEALLSEELPDYPATYPDRWGIEAPIPGFADQVVNVWLEMYPGLLTTAEAFGESGAPGSVNPLSDGEAVLVQFLGYDNSFFNSVLHAAVALSLPGQWPLPKHIITNEFYCLEDEKFSTSRDHAIWASDLLPEIGSDRLRYFVSRTNPEHWQTNFSLAAMARIDAEELQGIWTKAIGRLIHAHATGAGGPVDLDLQAQALIRWAKLRLEHFYDVDGFSLRCASRVLLDFVEACGEYVERHPGKSSAAGATIGNPAAVPLLKSIAVLSSPLLPELAQRLWQGIGFQGRVEDHAWSEAEVVHERCESIGGADWFSPPSSSAFMAV